MTGGPLEDLTGPALNNFIKFVAVVSFVTSEPRKNKANLPRADADPKHELPWRSEDLPVVELLAPLAPSPRTYMMSFLTTPGYGELDKSF